MCPAGCGNNNKDEDNSPKTPNDENHKASSQKFRQLISENHGGVRQTCNGYRRGKWTRRHEFKSWTRLIAFHIALIPLGKV